MSRSHAGASRSSRPARRERRRAARSAARRQRALHGAPRWCRTRCAAPILSMQIAPGAALVEKELTARFGAQPDAGARGADQAQGGGAGRDLPAGRHLRRAHSGRGHSRGRVHSAGAGMRHGPARGRARDRARSSRGWTQVDRPPARGVRGGRPGSASTPPTRISTRTLALARRLSRRLEAGPGRQEPDRSLPAHDPAGAGPHGDGDLASISRSSMRCGGAMTAPARCRDAQASRHAAAGSGASPGQASRVFRLSAFSQRACGAGLQAGLGGAASPAPAPAAEDRSLPMTDPADLSATELLGGLSQHAQPVAGRGDGGRHRPDRGLGAAAHARSGPMSRRPRCAAAQASEARWMKGEALGARRRARHDQGEYRGQGPADAARHRRARSRADGAGCAADGAAGARPASSGWRRRRCRITACSPRACRASTSWRATPGISTKNPGGSSAGAGAAGAAGYGPLACRHRYRRLDPAAGGLVRARRPEAQLRPGADRSALLRPRRRADDAHGQRMPP